MSELKEQLSTRDKTRADDLVKAYREVFDSAAGKLVLFDILSRCSIYSEAFAGDSHAITAHVLGKQSVGRELIGVLDAIDPRIYPQLLFDIADMNVMHKAATPATTEDDEYAP